MSDTETIEKCIEELKNCKYSAWKNILMRYARENFNRGVDAYKEKLKLDEVAHETKYKYENGGGQ